MQLKLFHVLNVKPTVDYVLEQYLPIIVILGLKYIGLNNIIDA